MCEEGGLTGVGDGRGARQRSCGVGGGGGRGNEEYIFAAAETVPDCHFKVAHAADEGAEGIFVAACAAV